MATEYHVRTDGNDGNEGSREAPLRTIQAAANRAVPGDVITVHGGVYRERVNPPRGGESDARRIVYQAAPGERVAIKGSEPVKGWARAEGEVWKAVVPNAVFGGLNPYREPIRGDWFAPLGRVHHTGAVYLDGNWLIEAARKEDVFRAPGAVPLWFAEVDDANTTFWAQFPGVDPNARLVEVNARRAVFYPDRPGRNYLTVRGFILGQAATQWAPPTAEQTAVIGTHWSRGWVIESNVVSHSVCSGISLGKYGDAFDNTSADTAEGYVKTIERALKNGWHKGEVGHHVVRGNVVSHCEQAGIVGSLGAAFCTVTDNVIHDIHVRRLFSGAEMAGIKFHAAIDTVIAGNHIYRTVRGLWLDWMAQGTRVTGNVFHDNLAEDLFMEVNHGPYLIDNNAFLSGTSLLDMSEGGAFVHNWFGGRLISRPEPGRETPFHPAHVTDMAGLRTTRGGDNRFFNNVFVGAGGVAGPVVEGKRKGEARDPHHAAGHGTWVYDDRPLPLTTGGNVYLHGARPYGKETDALVLPAVDPAAKAVDEGGRWVVRFRWPSGAEGASTRAVTSALLGTASVPAVGYDSADGSPISIDKDGRGRTRGGGRPTPGPWEGLQPGEVTMPVR